MQQQYIGSEYVKIAIANAFGLDKLLWQERIDWTESNQDNLYELVPEAKEPMLMLKAINALQDVKEGIPTGYIMALDSTASGYQIMSVLMGCETGARNTNLINTGERRDLYEYIGNKMGMSRDIVKRPIMTTAYGSTKQPETVFGEGTPELALFYKTLYKELPGAMECMEVIQGCWNPEALSYTWKLPDGHVSHMKVMVSKKVKIEVEELDKSTFTYITEVNAPQKKGLSLAANCIHSIDSWIVREMYRRSNAQGFELLTIHDSFWASPMYMNQVRQNYLDILMELNKMNFLESILRDITGQQDGTLDNVNTEMWRKMQDAEYALS